MVDRAPGVRVEGLSRLNSTLKRFAGDVEGMKGANVRVSQLVIQHARSRTPRRTGALAASMRPAQAKGRATIYAGGARLPYANPIHWGWASRGITAQPWLVDTIHATEPQWLRLYETEIETALRRVRGA